MQRLAGDCDAVSKAVAGLGYIPHWLWLVVSIVILLVAWYVLVTNHPRKFRRAAIVLVVLASSQLAVIVYTYGRWWVTLAGDDIASKLLPPHSLFYLAKVQTTVTSLAIGWVAALLLFWFLRRFFLVRHQGNFLDHADAALLTIGAGAVGWPSIFPFLAIVFILSVVFMIVLVIIRRRSVTDRLVITPAIIPAAIIVLIWQGWLLTITHLIKIGF